MKKLQDMTKAEQREQIARDTAAYIAKGGVIEKVPAGKSGKPEKTAQ